MEKLGLERHLVAGLAGAGKLPERRPWFGKSVEG